MSIKLQDFDSKVSDASLISSKDQPNQSTAAQVQKQQTRVLKQVYFLSTMSHYIFLGLSYSILNQDITKIQHEHPYSLKYLVSFSFITEDCARVIWGFVSDKIGRKKALNISLLGSALFMALYGFCKSFNSLAFTSSLLGVFSCSHIFIKTMLAESNCKASRPEAFSSLFIRSIIAIFISEIISSLFSVPHLDDVALDTSIPSITKFPYLIPSLIASGISVAAYILSNFYLSETLTGNISKLDGCIIADMPTSQIIVSTKSNQIRIFGLKFSKNSLLLLTLSSLYSLIYSGYYRITQDWPTMELSKGGLNLKYEHTLLVTPLLPIIAFTILIKYRYVYKKIDALNQFKAGFIVTGVLFILSLILTLVAKTGSTFTILSLYAISYSIECGISTLTDISFDLLLAESAEISGNLGTLYGVSSTLHAAISIVMYYVFGAFPVFSIENTFPFPFNNSLTWFLAILSLTGYWLSSKIKSTENQNQGIPREYSI